MKTLLHIAASPRREESRSRQAARVAIRHWCTLDPELAVIERDLATDPLPHPDACFVGASLTAETQRDEGQRQSLAQSDAMINELAAADAVLISMPMHNFFLPSSLKAWIDNVVRPGRTFRPTAQGKLGLLRDRPVRVLMACGGALGNGDREQKDWATPYLQYVFRTIGIHDVEVLALENCNRGPQAAEMTMRKLEGWLARQAL